MQEIIYDNKITHTLRKAPPLHHIFTCGSAPAEASVSHVKNAAKLATKMTIRYGHTLCLQSRHSFITESPSFNNTERNIPWSPMPHRGAPHALDASQHTPRLALSGRQPVPMHTSASSLPHREFPAASECVARAWGRHGAHPRLHEGSVQAQRAGFAANHVTLPHPPARGR